MFLVGLVVDQLPALGAAEGEVDDAVEDRGGRAAGAVDARGEGDLHVALLRRQRALPELRGHDALDGVEGLGHHGAQLGLVEGVPAGEALEVGAVAGAGAHGVLQEEVDETAPLHAGVGLAGAAFLDGMAGGAGVVGGGGDGLDLPGGGAGPRLPGRARGGCLLPGLEAEVGDRHCRERGRARHLEHRRPIQV